MNTKSESFLKLEPHLNRLQTEVYSELLSKRKATCEELAEGLKKPRHAITGRLVELQEKNLVEVVDKAKSKSSGRNVNVYAPLITEYQYSLF